ncbi:hypothetical protein NHH03_14070 [Stieleria sp. TO1_6]|uniref:hypothetical protein n=1 Tax=Stieleria tagensis TaxID=2956795 RepID=UPI00209A71D2|nr:hypothetical protein [Stieleria tagensis]MCO8122870.1 hypothetical protein [Stieleria tagensis]
MNAAYIISDEWCRKIPLLHQILAGTRSHKDFPDPTRVTDLHDACAVWETLHYLLKSLLGWQDPAQGLAWWYQNGQRNADSALLQLVSQVWGWDHAIDFYAAWAWSSSDPTTGEESFRYFPDDAWWTEFRRRSEPAWKDPYHGGSNPLHLGHSHVDPFGGIEGKLELTKTWELFHDEKTRRAVLIVDHIGVWRDALNRADGRLPSLGNRSWYVQIFDRQFGGLGTFRKSRVTGRWFQGKHSIHMAGNSPNNATEMEVA